MRKNCTLLYPPSSVNQAGSFEVQKSPLSWIFYPFDSSAGNCALKLSNQSCKSLYYRICYVISHLQQYTTIIFCRAFVRSIASDQTRRWCVPAALPFCRSTRREWRHGRRRSSRSFQSTVDSRRPSSMNPKNLKSSARFVS